MASAGKSLNVVVAINSTTSPVILVSVFVIGGLLAYGDEVIKIASYK